jgi:2-isopropylmalate synthase
VFTAFSGSHQDAIKKGFAALEATDGSRWEVPYLAIDPKEIGRTYDTVVRVNSHSGKGGVAYVLAAEHGYDLPRGLQVDFSRLIQTRTEASGGEIGPAEIGEAFDAAYVRAGRIRLVQYETTNDGVAGTPCTIDATLTDGVISRTIYGDGAGPIDAFVDGLARAFGVEVHVRDYSEHALRDAACHPEHVEGRLAGAEELPAVAYVEVAVDGDARWGVGIDPNIVTASLAAIVSAVGRTVDHLEPARREDPNAAFAVR